LLDFYRIKIEAPLCPAKEEAAPLKRGEKAMNLEKLVNTAIPIFCGFLLLLLAVITLLQIVLRQFFSLGLVWSDEVLQFCMTWLVLFGSIWLTLHDRHLNTGLKLHRKLNEKQMYLIDGVLALVITVIAAVVAYRSAIFSLQQFAMDSASLSWLKMGYVFIPLPLFMLAVCYYYLKNFFKNICLIFKKK
jgi:TRAP-type C4-dicarboxylate transport system permease small subunit